MVYEHKSAFFRFQGQETLGDTNRMTAAMDKASQEGWEVHLVSQIRWFVWVVVLVVFRRPRTSS